SRMSGRPRVCSVGVLLGLFIALICGTIASDAFAASPAPRMALHLFAMPSHFSQSNNAECLESIGRGEGGVPCNRYQITATNAGGARAKKPIEIVDVVPS